MICILFLRSVAGLMPGRPGRMPIPPAATVAISRRSHPKSKCSVYNLRQETPETSQKSPSNEYHTEHFT